MNKELEGAIKYFINFTKYNRELAKKERKYDKQYAKDLEKRVEKFTTILNYIENSMPKEVVEENLNKLQSEYELLLEHQNGQESNRTKYLRGKIHMCQELLQEKGEK